MQNYLRAWAMIRDLNNESYFSKAWDEYACMMQHKFKRQESWLSVNDLLVNN